MTKPVAETEPSSKPCDCTSPAFCMKNQGTLQDGFACMLERSKLAAPALPESETISTYNEFLRRYYPNTAPAATAERELPTVDRLLSQVITPAPEDEFAQEDMNRGAELFWALQKHFTDDYNRLVKLCRRYVTSNRQLTQALSDLARAQKQIAEFPGERDRAIQLDRAIQFGQTMAKFRQEAEQQIAALSDSARVHSNILTGQIALTKAQAIHIAGLPADIEQQIAALQGRIEKAVDELRVEIPKMQLIYKSGELCTTPIYYADPARKVFDSLEYAIAILTAPIAPE